MYYQALSPMAAAFLPDFALPQPARPSGCAPALPPSLPAAASAAQLEDYIQFVVVYTVYKYINI